MLFTYKLNLSKIILFKGYMLIKQLRVSMLFVKSVSLFISRTYMNNNIIQVLQATKVSKFQFAVFNKIYLVFNRKNLNTCKLSKLIK